MLMKRMLLWIGIVVMAIDNVVKAQLSPFFAPVPFGGGVRVESCQEYQMQEEGVLLDPACLLQGRLPAFTLEEKVDIVWDYLADWGKGYQPELQQARYHFESLPLKNTAQLFPLESGLRNQLLQAKFQSQGFLVHKSYLAPLVIQNLAFFSSHKDISML